MTKPHKHLFVVSTAKKIGGGELSLIQLLRAMHPLGWQATIFFPPENTALHRVFSAENREHFPLTRTQLALQACRSLFQTNKIFYANSYAAAKFLLFLDPFHRFPRIVHLRESFFDPLSTHKARWILTQMDMLIAISSAVKEEVCHRAGVPDEKVVVVSNGVPDPEFADRKEEIAVALRDMLQIPHNTPLIALAGRTDPLKGHHTFLKSMPIIYDSHPDVHFLIIGLDPPQTSPLAHELHKLIEQSPIRKNIHTFPFVENARWFMSASTMLVVPSLSEGFGRVAIEAMMEKTPVVASKVGGLGEIFLDRQEGIYFETENFCELAQACIFLLNNSQIRASIAAEGQKRSLSDYTISNTARKISTRLNGMERARS
ncbi:MAG: glycosyltransferase family 4 protein [Terrimicrobiaceae bacterium]